MRFWTMCLMVILTCTSALAAGYPQPTASYSVTSIPMQLGSPSGLDFRSNFTLAAKVKLTSSEYGQIVGANESGGLVAGLDNIKLASWGHDWVVKYTLPENEWVFIAATMDTDGLAKVFVNGKAIASTKMSPWPKAPENWTIGGWAVGERFRGSLANVLIWNTALDADQIMQVASSFGLDKPVKLMQDTPAPISQTPASVKAMAKQMKNLAIEPGQLPRYPFSAMMGAERFSDALRLRSYKQWAEAEKWLADEIPTFDCPDPIWKRCYYYRWFVVLANYQEEDSVPGFYEGKRGPYTRHITYSAPHIMDEVRWLRDGKYAYGQAEILGKRREPNGRRFGGYTHWIASTLWGAYLVHPDKKKLAELLPAWQEDTECAFAGKLDATRPDADYLLAPPSHWTTGMEWQPAWFYFDNYDKTKETKLWRPDYTAYYYANARAVADALRVLGNPTEAAKFDKLADRVKGAVEHCMWDPKTDYFYSIKVGTDQKAWVKECVGIYPFTFDLPSKDKSAAFKSILDPKEFWGKWLITSCDMNCPMYTPKVQLCNWDGPVWPHADSLVANALANGVRTYKAPGVTPAKLYQFIDSYTKLHYEDKGTWKHPNIHEEGNADDGQMYGCPDYFHSTYNDLIIRLVGGLVPRNDGSVELYPVVDVPWDHFRLDRVPYRGHMLSIVWDSRAKGRYAGVPKGYSLYVDGKLIGTKPKLEHVVFSGILKK